MHIFLKPIAEDSIKTVGEYFQNGKWEFMRERTDKSLPNSVKTAKAVYNSIIYPIHKEMLIDFVERNCLPKCTKRLRVANSDESTGKRGRC